MQGIKAHNSAVYKSELMFLFKRVDQVLRGASIEYFGVFGTCLGAIREGGIIPWDDDIDIAVRRSDYESALKVLASSDKQIFVHRKDFRYGRLFNRVMQGDSIERKRAYIDLYVIDSAPESRILYIWSVFWYVGITRILAKRSGENERHHPLLYLITDIVCAPLRLLPSERLMRLSEIAYIYKGRSTKVKLSFDANRKRYASRLFSKSVRVPFGDVEIAVPKCYDEYLCICYGDWRTPPPLADRVGHAVDRSGQEWNVVLPDDSERPIM